MESIKEDIKQASLDARINLTAGEESVLKKQLSAILAQAEALKTPAVDNAEPTFFPHTQENTLREDTISTSLPLDKVMENAPETDHSYFLVPKIVE